MSNNDINYKKFIEYVHKQYETKFTREEVEEILQLEEDYNRDNPMSLGKSLLLNRLIFSGEKISGEKLYYDKTLYKGINAWIADNNKGKSTIFNIIKFALTGKDKIKPDIKSWIDEIILEFQIGKVIYTIYIDRTGRDKGAVYRFEIEKFLNFRKNQKLDMIEREKEFEFKSNVQFEERIQEFFFEHFDFYTLKYTQKKSSKEDLGLSIANLSWSTYFRSIYLEASNYGYLFFDTENMGAQGRKIFAMILGLPLTYPINMLTIQQDKVSEEIGKLKLVDKSRTETKKLEKEQLTNRYIEVKKSLEEIKENAIFLFDEKPLIEEYNKIQENVNENRKIKRSTNEKYETEKNNLSILEEEIRNLEQDKRKVEIEINKLTKQGLDIELYIETESFFTNLDIKVCPHCEVEVSETRKENERKNHTCSLCGQTSTQQKIDTVELQDRQTRIIKEKEGHTTKLHELIKNIEYQKGNSEKLKKTIDILYSEFKKVPSLETEIKRLNEIEIQIEVINKEREKKKDLIKTKEELIKEEAVLKFQLSQIEKEEIPDNSEEIAKLELKRDIIKYAIDALRKKQLQLNIDILSKLEILILDEIHAFGLSSIDKIKIDDKYDLIFTQNKVNVSFSELNPGEKLRVKLAFYLSLIQLDIEHNLGRHPRFLIFDAPGREEMIEEHVHGLSKIFKYVNHRFKDKLQIFVGSALRELTDITDPEKATIKEKDEFVF